MRKRLRKKLLRKTFSIVDDSANLPAGFPPQVFKLDNSKGKSSAYFIFSKGYAHVQTIHIPKGVTIDLTGQMGFPTLAGSPGAKLEIRR